MYLYGVFGVFLNGPKLQTVIRLTLTPQNFIIQNVEEFLTSTPENKKEKKKVTLEIDNSVIFKRMFASSGRFFSSFMGSVDGERKKREKVHSFSET